MGIGRERGFAWQLGLISAGLLGIALAITWNALGNCHAERAKQRVRLEELSKRVAEQNLLVAALEKEALTRSARAKAALDEAKAEGRVLDAKITMLRGKLAKPSPTFKVGECAAAQGVAEARKALKP